ncbi:MAG: hypothetical protein AAF611_15340 [Bacteroidota bacterium]
MKKNNFKNLTLNKASISSLQYKLHGGFQEQQEGEEGPDDGPAPILSIGHACSLRNTCARVCIITARTLCEGTM